MRTKQWLFRYGRANETLGLKPEVIESTRARYAEPWATFRLVSVLIRGGGSPAAHRVVTVENETTRGKTTNAMFK